MSGTVSVQLTPETVPDTVAFTKSFLRSRGCGWHLLCLFGVHFTVLDFCLRQQGFETLRIAGRDQGLVKLPASASGP